MRKTTSEFQLNHTPALNGIRGLAVLLVIAFHTGIPAFSGGFIGVDIFFVLSGFLITAILLEEYSHFGKINFKYFYIRRALRLFPALALLVVVYIILGSTIVSQVSISDVLRESSYAIFYIANLVLAFGFDSIVFLGHAWSLSMEEQFYLIWPVFLLAMLTLMSHRNQLLVCVSLLALIAWAYRAYSLIQLESPDINRIFYGPDTRTDGLLIGCALAILVSTNVFERLKTNPKFSISLKCLSLAAFLTLSYFSFIVRIGNPNLYYWQLFALEICVAVIILDTLFSSNSWIGKILENPVLTWIGRVSYGLYLWHFLIFSLLAFQGLPPLRILLIGIPLTFVAAALSFYLLELRFLDMQQRFKLRS